jgi:hypothetical protein
LAQDGDLLLAGVPGSGRHTLIRTAAQQVGTRVLEIDCLRATNAVRFLELLAEGLLEVFSDPTELALIQRWSTEQPLILEQAAGRKPHFVWHLFPKEEWGLFQTLLALPQVMADWLECRVVLVLQNFPHIRSWDRSGKWETYLQTEIQRQTRVSYVLIATVAEAGTQSQLQVIALGPLDPKEIADWIGNSFAAQGLQFNPDQQALMLFVDYVQGHLGAAISLAHRIWLEGRATAKLEIIQAHHIHRSALALVEDLSSTFESLILLLPPTQVRVLESLALDPTDSPHARDYIQKHQLSRGGGLQGALASLEQKGLIHGSKYCYRLTMPFLAFWLKQRLT